MYKHATRKPVVWLYMSCGVVSDACVSPSFPYSFFRKCNGVDACVYGYA